MSNKAERLSALKNRRTAYEAVLVTPEGEKFCLGYLSRKGLLLRLIQAKGEKILARLGLPHNARVTCEVGGFAFSNGARVMFSGRTQRDAILLGEHPPV